MLEPLPFDRGRHNFFEMILPVDPLAALPMLAHGLADITVEMKFEARAEVELLPREIVLRDTPLVEVTAAEVAKVGMEARKFCGTIQF